MVVHAELLTNGGFESEANIGSGIRGDSGCSALSGSQIPGWTIASSHAGTVHNTDLYPTISGICGINMDGEGQGGGNAILHQDFASSRGDVAGGPGVDRRTYGLTQVRTPVRNPAMLNGAGRALARRPPSCGRT